MTQSLNAAPPAFMSAIFFQDSSSLYIPQLELEVSEKFVKFSKGQEYSDTAIRARGIYLQQCSDQNLIANPINIKTLMEEADARVIRQIQVSFETATELSEAVTNQSQLLTAEKTLLREIESWKSNKSYEEAIQEEKAYHRYCYEGDVFPDEKVLQDFENIKAKASSTKEVVEKTLSEKLSSFSELDKKLSTVCLIINALASTLLKSVASS